MSKFGNAAAQHSVWFKRLLNPILRKCGWSIVSVFNDRGVLLRYEMRKYPKHCALI
jgi:hypothetical protein